MKFSKKCISVVFSAVFTFSAVSSQSATFASTVAPKSFSYNVVDKNKKTAIITKIAASVPVPLRDPIDGYSIIEVADNASLYKQIKDRHIKKRVAITAITAATLPTIIMPAFVLGSKEAEMAFKTNISFTGPMINSVDLPNCVKVGKNSFVFCNRLETIDLPKCESLAKGSLYGCTSITRLNIPQCKRIDTILDDTDERFGHDYYDRDYIYKRYYYRDYSSFKELNAPNCTEVAAFSFSELAGLEKVNLQSCKKIGKKAFYGCKSLKTLDLPNCTEALSFDGGKFYGWHGAFGNCEKLESINIPNLTFAGRNCFKNCKALKSVDLSKCKEINESCCEDCISLTTALLDSANEIQNYAFKNCSSLQSVRVPSVVSIGEGAFCNTALKRIDLLNCRSVGKDAFKNCKTLSVFNSPNLTSIGESAFEGDENLEEVNLPNCKVIAKNAFKNCYKLKKITIPKSCKLEENSLPYDLLVNQKLEIVRI